jgi:peptidoglycan/LPS O-acetylase OafA/YrhL
MQGYVENFTASDSAMLARALDAVPLFLSNVLFAIANGYFNMALETKPLIHTWSLAIEEQYYVIFPILIISFLKFGINWLIKLLVILTCFGIISAQWRTFNYPEYNFYLLPTRGWEILIGSKVKEKMLQLP